MNGTTENPHTFVADPLAALEADAAAMVSRCIECGSCYVDCAFGNYGDDPDRCREWIRESNDFLLGRRKKLSPALVDANLKCAECNRCFNSCPEGIYRRHGNMLMKHRTGNPARHAVNLHPYANWKLKQPVIEKLSVTKWPAEEREWYRRLNEPREAEVLLYHGCYVYLQAAQCLKLETLLDAAGVSYTSFGKLEYCCGTFGFYRGRDDMAEIKPRLLEMVEAVKPQRILTNCGHCLNAMDDLVGTLPAGKAPVVRHAVQEFLELIVAGRLDVAHLERTFAVHDSCNFRDLHDSHGPLRSLLRRMGTVHEMLSHGRDGKCCGDVSRYYAPEHIDADNRAGKVREFVSSGADQMVTVCAGCYEHFHAAPQLRAVDLIDLVYEGYGKARSEDLAAQPQVRHRWENMAPVLDGEGES